MNAWIDYSEKRPEIAGPYEWSIPSKTMKGERIVIAAWMRERGAGYENVLSPSFDYWDGYRVHVPAGIKWRECRPEHRGIKWHEEVVIGVESRELRPCQFCGAVPAIKAYRVTNGGVSLSPSPDMLNCFHLECCREGSVKRAESITEAEQVRAENFMKADAPALLDALEEYVKIIGANYVGIEYYNKARALIAKHRGGV